MNAIRYFICTAILSLWMTYSNAQDFSPLVNNKTSVIGSKLPQRQGVDLFLNGKSADALSSGEVSGIFRQNDKLYTVLVKDNDRVYLYGNLKEVSVAVGDQLTQGVCVGLVDAGQANSNVLHFEIWDIKGSNARILGYAQTKSEIGISGPN